MRERGICSKVDNILSVGKSIHVIANLLGGEGRRTTVQSISEIA